MRNAAAKSDQGCGRHGFAETLLGRVAAAPEADCFLRMFERLYVLTEELVEGLHLTVISSAV
jgi:hypothetical protein